MKEETVTIIHWKGRKIKMNGIIFYYGLLKDMSKIAISKYAFMTVF